MCPFCLATMGLVVAGVGLASATQCLNPQATHPAPSGPNEFKSPYEISLNRSYHR